MNGPHPAVLGLLLILTNIAPNHWLVQSPQVIHGGLARASMLHAALLPTGVQIGS